MTTVTKHITISANIPQPRIYFKKGGELHAAGGPSWMAIAELALRLIENNDKDTREAGRELIRDMGENFDNIREETENGCTRS